MDRVAVPFDAAAHQPDRRDERHQEEVALCDALDFKARHGDFLPKLPRVIPASMPDRYVMHAPQPLVCRQTDYERRTRSEHACNFTERGRIVCEIANDVE